MILALFKRWWYLVTCGMFRGECAVTLYHPVTRKILVIGSGRAINSRVFAQHRIFWTRLDPPGKTSVRYWFAFWGCIAIFAATIGAFIHLVFVWGAT